MLRILGPMTGISLVMVVCIAAMGGASVGYTANDTSELDFSEDVNITESGLEESHNTTLLGISPERAEEFNERLQPDYPGREYIEDRTEEYTLNTARTITHMTLNYVSEPVARFTYNNQWIPLAFWKLIGYLGAIIPLGYAAFRFKEVIPNV